MRKLSALLIEHEHQSMERANLIFGIATDEHHLKEANVQLDESEYHTGQIYLSLIGHEFRSRFSDIQGFSELLG